MSAKTIGQQFAVLAPLVNNIIISTWRSVGITTSTQMLILQTLARGATTQANIISILGIAAPTLSKQIDALEKCGYVAREIDRDDRRRMLVQLTATGEAKMNQANELIVHGMAQALEGCGEEQLRHVSEALDVIFAQVVTHDTIKMTTKFPLE